MDIMIFRCLLICGDVVGMFCFFFGFFFFVLFFAVTVLNILLRVFLKMRLLTMNMVQFVENTNIKVIIIFIETTKSLIIKKFITMDTISRYKCTLLLDLKNYPSLFPFFDNSQSNFIFRIFLTPFSRVCFCLELV